MLYSRSRWLSILNTAVSTRILHWPFAHVLPWFTDLWNEGCSNGGGRASLRLQPGLRWAVSKAWATSLSLFTFMHWRRKWQPTPVFLPGESQGRGSLVAAVYGVAKSRARLKRLSSSSALFPLPLGVVLPCPAFLQMDTPLVFISYIDLSSVAFSQARGVSFWGKLA